MTAIFRSAARSRCFVSAAFGFAASGVVHDKGNVDVGVRHGDSLRNAVYLIRLDDGDALSGVGLFYAREPPGDTVLKSALVL
jgi:hypothetical protein